MKFVVVLVGVSLLVIGLLAYAIIPNVHTIPVESRSSLAQPPPIVVNPNFQAETQQNVTVVPAKSNRLLVNLSVSKESGAPSSIQFKLFTESQLQNCTRETNPTGCLVDQSVSNQTLAVPLNATSTFYFYFDNRDSSFSKVVLLSTSLVASSVNSFTARDGQFNFAALALGAIGLIVAVYGVAAKTVIPWE